VESKGQKFQGIIPTLVKIGKEEGFRGYFKGNGTNVARIIPYVAVQFAAYEEFKKVSCSPGLSRVRVGVWVNRCVCVCVCVCVCEMRQY